MNYPFSIHCLEISLYFSVVGLHMPEGWVGLCPVAGRLARYCLTVSLIP